VRKSIPIAFLQSGIMTFFMLEDDESMHRSNHLFIIGSLVIVYFSFDHELLLKLGFH